MKQVPEILQSIRNKITEHKNIMTQIESDLGQMRSLLQKLNEQGNKQDLMQESAKLLVLKDKMLFHKACVLVLEDLKKEIES